MAEASLREGNYFCYIGEFEYGIACLDKAIQIKPDLHQAYNIKGNSLHALGKYEDAIECFNKAIQIRPDSALYYCNLANTLLELKKDSEALKMYKKAKFLLDTKEQKGMTPDNMEYMKDTLARISDLEASVQEVEANLKELDPNSFVAKTFIAKLAKIKNANREVISHINPEKCSENKESVQCRRHWDVLYS